MSALSVAHSIKHIKKALGLTQDDFARSIGASSRSIRRWETKAVSINESTAEKLELLDGAIHSAADIMKKDEIEAWFQTTNPALEGVKPIELISSYSGLQRIQRTLTELEWGLF